MRNKKVLFAVQAAMIAALYVVLTYITNLLGLASGTIQVRFSEALCILPVFTPAAIPGLFIGCLISNLITGGIIWDIIFGSIATLLGALGTYFLRKKKFVYTLPPVIANIIIVPLVLRYGYGFTTIYKGRHQAFEEMSELTAYFATYALAWKAHLLSQETVIQDTTSNMKK